MLYVISLLYGKWSIGNYSLKSSFNGGALIGFFVGFGIDHFAYETPNLIDLLDSLADAVWSVLYYSITVVFIV